MGDHGLGLAHRSMLRHSCPGCFCPQQFLPPASPRRRVPALLVFASNVPYIAHQSRSFTVYYKSGTLFRHIDYITATIYIYQSGRIRRLRQPAEPRFSISRVRESGNSKHTIHLYIKLGWLWPITDHATLDEVCRIRRDSRSDTRPSFFHCERQVQPFAS